MLRFPCSVMQLVCAEVYVAVVVPLVNGVSVGFDVTILGNVIPVQPIIGARFISGSQISCAFCSTRSR